MIESIHVNLLERLFEGVYYVDKTRKVAYWNRAAEDITGFSRDDVVGRFCHDALLRHIAGDGTLLCQNGCPLQKTLEDGETREVEIFLHHKAGHRVPVSVRIAPVPDSDGHIVGAMEMFHLGGNEMAQQKRIRQLEQMAFIDPLTELPNRRFLSYQLESRLDELKRYNWPFGVLMMDVDKFKEINDTHGHDTGDSVLKMVAATLSGAARTLDLVARFGGEEFVAVVTNVNLKRLVEVGERFRTLVGSSYVRTPQVVGVTLSIGAVIADKIDSVESLLKRSDIKLYEAKSTGRNRVVF